MKLIFTLCILVLVQLTLGKIYFSEEGFKGDWESRWIHSTNKVSEGTAGKFDISAGKYYGDAVEDRGLHTTQDARFYSISAKFEEFSNKGKTFVLQYRIKHEQNIDCGGGYIKLLPAGTDQVNFNGDSNYNVMFGPDVCGSTKRVHLIFNYKGKNHLINKQIQPESDDLSHIYTLIVRPDNTYEIKIDGKQKAAGKLDEDWDFLPPKRIKDPKLSKPSDWVDDKEIPDPTDKKPEGWDDVPRETADPSAKKPEDWDNDLDGEWEAPVVPNPEWKGDWKPKMIPNPDYKGEWVHPEIDNPDYKYDENIYAFDSFGVLGIEIWQVKSGTIFDDFIVTDSEAEAEAEVEEDLKDMEKEKKMKEAEEEKKRKEDEEKRKLEEEKAKTEKKDDEHEHDHDHDHNSDHVEEPKVDL